MTKQYPLPLPHSTAMGADNYVVTDSNREAAAWVNAWPEWPSHALIVLGPSGSGKSHLLHVWLQNSGGKLVDVEDLKHKDAGGIATGNSIIAIDNIDRVAGDRETETTLFHLYNYLKDHKGFLLMTATNSPASWGKILPDLRSRLLAAPVATIGVPDDELLTMLLVKQFHDRQIAVSSDVITYLLPRIERTAAALRDIVTTLDQASLAEGKGITVSLVKKVIGEQSFLSL